MEEGQHFISLSREILGKSSRNTSKNSLTIGTDSGIGVLEPTYVPLTRWVNQHLEIIFLSLIERTNWPLDLELPPSTVGQTYLETQTWVHDFYNQ